MNQAQYEKLSPDEKVDKLNVLQKECAVAGQRKCIVCREALVFAPDTHARIHGHIYSAAGIKESYITRICEYCFDEIAGGTNEEL